MAELHSKTKGKSKRAGAMKQPTMAKACMLAAIMAMAAAIIISGCTTQQQPKSEQPQPAEGLQQTHPEAVASPPTQPAEEPKPAPAAALEEDDIYKDNLDGATEELNQLG